MTPRAPRTQKLTKIFKKLEKNVTFIINLCVYVWSVKTYGS